MSHENSQLTIAREAVTKAQQLLLSTPPEARGGDPDAVYFGQRQHSALEFWWKRQGHKGPMVLRLPYAGRTVSLKVLASGAESLVQVRQHRPSHTNQRRTS